MAFQFRENSKFAMLALDGIYSELPMREFHLADGTWVMPRVPGVADLGIWKEWIGSIRAGSLERANLVLLNEEASDNPLILDDVHQRLRDDLSQLFYFLHFRQGIECAGAIEPDLLCGSSARGEPIIRQMNKLPAFYQSRGYTRAPITQEWLKEALALRSGSRVIGSATGEFRRAIRGLNVLFSGLRETGQEGFTSWSVHWRRSFSRIRAKPEISLFIAVKPSHSPERLRSWRSKRYLTCAATRSICRTGTGLWRPTLLQNARTCVGSEHVRPNGSPALRIRECC